MGGACSQKLKSRRGLPSSSGRFCIGWDAATLTQDPIGQQKPASPGLQLVGEIHYCWGGSNLGWVISAKRPRNDQAFRAMYAGVRLESRSINAGDTFASRRNGGACRARRRARARKHREQQESPRSSVELGALIWARENRRTFPGQLLLWRFSQWILFSVDLAAF